MNKDKGYIIFDNGLIQEYNNISKTKTNKKQLDEEKLNEIKEQIELVDETKVNTIYTSIAVTSGMNIYVYNLEGKKIMLKDFYSTNYSDAANTIMDILKDYNLL